jgi:hypothetical protein
MKKHLIFTLLILGLSVLAESAIPQPEQRIPFEIARNKVILPVRINGSRPLKIILDSGMTGRGIILFKKDLGDELSLKGAEQYRIRGAGQGKESYAIRAESQELTVGEILFTGQPVLVLQNDTMSDFPTDGVIGNTIFGQHAVRFDFEKKIITLLRTGTFHPDSSWETLDMTLNDHGIPFIKAAVSVSGEPEIPLRVYIDSASSEALELLVRPEQKFSLPENLETRYLGRGLSGDISGQFGRVATLRVGSFELKDVPTAFPSAEVRSRQPGADGIICNNILLRFHVVLDISAKKLFLKPNSLFGKSFS